MLNPGPPWPTTHLRCCERLLLMSGYRMRPSAPRTSRPPTTPTTTPTTTFLTWVLLSPLPSDAGKGGGGGGGGEGGGEGGAICGWGETGREANTG
jgi:hypothetical protein